MTQLRAAQIAARHGFTARHWIRQAAAGLIPGARQPSGPGGQWLFDAREFEKWSADQGLPKITPDPSPAPADIVIRPKRKAQPSDVVYLIYSAGHVKIGVSSNIAKRKYSFSTASPAPLALLVTIPGSNNLEGDLHRRFAAAHARGEWFRLTAELRTFIVESQRVYAPHTAIDEAEIQYRSWASGTLA